MSRLILHWHASFFLVNPKTRSWLGDLRGAMGFEFVGKVGIGFGNFFRDSFSSEYLAKLLWRKLPMDWCTTTNRVTTEINPFPYVSEIKHLTLKDLETYLILDGWCRSLLSFSTLACISNLLSQHAIYNCVRPTLAYIINNV